jgi:pimeloyl-ACP methyl ester carboxylesterase
LRDAKETLDAGDIANHRIGITRAASGVILRGGCMDLLDRIKMHVGIGVGADDVATEPERSRRIHAAINGSELAVFEGAGHSSSIETPALVIQLIQRTIVRSAR